ncbi:MAG: hypothetical protein E7352_01420 [Clostridiales bacterium]|nr:hypothetical protein [Clostridiales bacterium]
MQCCFIGHRVVEKKEELLPSLRESVLTLIHIGVTTFLFGGRGEFDALSWKMVTELQKEYPFIKRVYVRSAYQYIDKAYEEYLLESYEETYFPSKLERAGKYSYVERNYEMIENSTYCVFYYNENYVVPLRQDGKNNLHLQARRNSGARIAYQYAVKRKKTIINLYKQSKDATL